MRGVGWSRGTTRGHRSPGSRRRLTSRLAHARAAIVVVVAGLLPGLLSFSPALAPHAAAAPATCGTGGAGTCAVTIDARDFASGVPLANFTYLVNLDNTKSPSDPLALNTESYSPVVRTGDQTRATVTLPDGHYMVSARSLDHKMWGAYFTLPDDAADNSTLTVRIDLTEQSDAHPLPLGKLNIFVFEDNAWTNGAPDAEEAAPATGGLGGFQIGLEEQTGSEVTVDYFNNPLCGGVCKTEGDGFKQIDNLGPATYFADVHPPDHCNPDPNAPNRLTTGPGHWYQTTTIDGGLNLMTPVEEGSDGTGAPGEQLWEPPDRRTAYWFGFVCTPLDWPTTGPYSGGTGEIVGQARNWVEWAPYTTGTYDTPVDNPFVALTDAATDTTVFMGRGDENGNFDIQNVPAGTFNMSIWDEQLNYIMRFKPVTVAAGQTVDVNDTADNGEVGVGVSRWFGWLDGTVYKDQNGNGQYDAGVDTPIANTDMDQRWRDGSIKEDTFTDASGHYEYPTAEGGALGRWFINEQGFARFSAYPGASAHDEHTGDVTPSCVVEPPNTPANPCVPNSQGGGLLMNQTTLEGHRATVDWGKRDYAPGTPGQIVGITYFATTRNEFDARFQAHENYEPAIPDVTVYLETPGPDGLPNTDDDVVANKYVTDHWQQPNASQDPQDNGQGGANSFTQNCNPIRDFNGADITNQFAAKIGPNCLEVPLTGNQTKEGAFDGGYAFADYCPNGYDLAADDGTCTGGSDPVPLVAGNYITHVVVPQDSTDSRPCNDPSLPAGDVNVTAAKGSVPGNTNGCLFRIVKEEDVNVDLGNHFAPQIPPPTCDGDAHVIDQSTLTPRSVFYTGDQSTSPSKPLCDKHLVVLQNQQNANADFFLMSNFRNDPNGQDASDTRTGDVAEPGRLVGQVFNDIYFERNPQSPWYGEPRPIGNIPVGIYARVDTVCPDGGTTGCATPNVNQPYDPNNWRLLKTVLTSPDGSFEALVPSTETFNCPIPQGPCPGMYLIKVDDPGTTASPNPTFNPNLLVATTPAEAWPGLTTQLDLPLDPISGTGCDFSVNGDGTASTVPELLQVATPAGRTDRAATPPVVTGTATAANRQITIYGDFIGPAGPTGATGGHVNLTDVRTGDVTTLTRANGGVVSWTPGSGSTPDTIVIQVPAINTTTFRPGPKQLTIVGATSNGGQSSVNGLTIHVLGSNGAGTNLVTYNPPVVSVPPPPPAGTDPHALQNAIDAAPVGALVVLSPGVYNENVVQWKPLKIQGLGPGGIIGAHELNTRAPEDPRFHVVGSLIDGRFFQQNATAYDATVAAHGPYAVDPTFSTIMRGADITAVAQTTTAYAPATLPATQNQRAFYNSRVDGLGLMTGRGDGAGGIQLQANINNMQLTNNILENNGGIFAGGIGSGQPYAHGNHNFGVRIGNDRILGNGGLTRSGGIGIFYGSNNYEVASSIFCSNFGVEYGAGISHWGLSPGGSIHDNQIYYNDAVDSGAGIAIQTELPVGADCTSPGATITTCRGNGSGAVNVDRNLIQSNFSGDDGGGIFIADAFTQPMNIRNNMIVDNGAADLGGAIMLDDSSNARIVNNTVANNVTTASSENSAIGVPHSAGLAAEANEPLFQATLPAGSPDFSNPSALFNNIFWDNDAMTLSQFGPGATLVDAGFIDFEVHGTTNNADTFTPRYSTLTNGNILGPDGVQRPVPAGQGNRIGIDPGFVTPFTLELTVSGSRLDPQAAAVNITGQDPPVGLTGNYHLLATSDAIDRGVRCSNTPFPAPVTALLPCTGGGIQAPSGTPGDYDGQYRPQLRTLRPATPWDLGADELPGVPIPLL
jgi:large repetitive protein